MEESVEPISLVDYSKAFHDVDRYMDIWFGNKQIGLYITAMLLWKKNNKN